MTRSRLLGALPHWAPAPRRQSVGTERGSSGAPSRLPLCGLSTTFSEAPTGSRVSPRPQPHPHPPHPHPRSPPEGRAASFALSSSHVNKRWLLSVGLAGVTAGRAGGFPAPRGPQPCTWPWPAGPLWQASARQALLSLAGLGFLQRPPRQAPGFPVSGVVRAQWGRSCGDFLPRGPGFLPEGAQVGTGVTADLCAPPGVGARLWGCLPAVLAAPPLSATAGRAFRGRASARPPGASDCWVPPALPSLPATCDAHTACRGLCVCETLTQCGDGVCLRACVWMALWSGSLPCLPARTARLLSPASPRVLGFATHPLSPAAFRSEVACGPRPWVRRVLWSVSPARRGAHAGEPLRAQWAREGAESLRMPESAHLSGDTRTSVNTHAHKRADCTGGSHAAGAPLVSRLV